MSVIPKKKLMPKLSRSVNQLNFFFFKKEHIHTKTIKVIKNKESLRNCYSKGQTKKIQKLNVMRYPGTEKDIR